MRQAILIATLLFAFGCSDGPPPPGAQRWERSELVGHIYTLVSEELNNSYSFTEQEDFVQATIGRKGGGHYGPGMAPEWRWTIDENGVLNFGSDPKSPDFRWAKIKVDGDQVTIATSSGWKESNYKKTKRSSSESPTK